MPGDVGGGEAGGEALEIGDEKVVRPVRPPRTLGWTGRGKQGQERRVRRLGSSGGVVLDAVRQGELQETGERAKRVRETLILRGSAAAAETASGYVWGGAPPGERCAGQPRWRELAAAVAETAAAKYAAASMGEERPT